VLLGRRLNTWLGDPHLRLCQDDPGISRAGTTLCRVLAGDEALRSHGGGRGGIARVVLCSGSRSVGLTYAGEAFGASLVAVYAYGALKGSPRALYLGALTLGLMGGMRQSVLVLLFPLWLGCALIGVRAVTPLLTAGGVLIAAVLSWFMPMVWLTGGVGAYARASAQLYESVVWRTSVLEGSLDIVVPGALPGRVGHRRAGPWPSPRWRCLLRASSGWGRGGSWSRGSHRPLRSTP
jgi:hypothetical protein